MSADGLFRFAAVAMRRYSREPSTRAASARALLSAPINIYAVETSPGEAALTTAEVLGDLVQRERLASRAEKAGAR